MSILDDGMTIDEALADAQARPVVVDVFESASSPLFESTPMRFRQRAADETSGEQGERGRRREHLLRDTDRIVKRMNELQRRLALAKNELTHLERVDLHESRDALAPPCDGPDRLEAPAYTDSIAYQRCSPKSRTLLETLLRQEQRTARNENHIHLVLLASTLIEAEMGALLAEPAREVVQSILDAQKAHNPKYKTDALEGWTEKKLSTSLGIEIMILCGLRWGLLQERPDILDFVDRHFSRGYVRLARDIRLAAAVDVIRAEYRNPAAHGKRVEYGRRDFSELCRLAIGKASFSRWLPKPGKVRRPDVGVLHNHLILRKGIEHPPADDLAF